MLRKLSLLALSSLLIPQFAWAQPDTQSSYRLLKLDGRVVKWGEPTLGTATELTYGFVTEPTQFDDARNCQSTGSLTPILEYNKIPARDFQTAATNAFAMWESVSGIRFRKADNIELADILIGSDLGNHGWAHADVLTAPSGVEVDTITRGLICLSTNKVWNVGFGQNENGQDLQYTLTHEIGHAIGLNHASPYGQIMSFNYGEAFADLQQGDIDGVRRLYGMPTLSHNTLATAEQTPLR